MRIKYLAQEHNAVPRPGLEPGPPDLESSALTVRPPRLPHIVHMYSSVLFVCLFSGDQIVSVNGHPVMGKSYSQVIELIVSR